ncbi:MAG TPA: PrsW family intramembrane metalloprotease [Arachnia sp.]|nr:PrsW family intramembrane metalloprotease [Arachnia sp.]
MSTADAATRDRWLNGLEVVDTRPWYRRLLRSPLFWMTIVLLPAYVYFLFAQYWMLAPSQEFEDGSMTLGISNEAFRKAGFAAMWTALAYSALFIWLDRFRASSPVVWLLTFGWGACASTWFSLHVNTWAGQMMSTTEANSDAGSRAAIFSAPFVEEFAKATILVLLVVLWRNRIVSRLSMVALAGLSAVGFAFTENIIYYARVWMQATNDITIADPDATMRELVMLRGVYTSFGHPLFTMMTAAGLVIGLSARSKIVRVLAPLGGFMLACAGHMLFNGLASTNPVEALMRPYYMALVVVAIVVASLVVSVIGNAQLIRTRLGDYQRAGWLTERQVELYGRPMRRVKLIWFAMMRGPRVWWQTTRLLRRVTELAYLRNQMTRGTVAGPGDARARELIHLIDRPGPRALTDYQGLRMLPPRRRKNLPPPPPGQSPGQLTAQYPPPQAPGPAGVGGNWPVRQ